MTHTHTTVQKFVVTFVVFHENIHEMICKMNGKYSQGVDKVINHDFLNLNNNCVVQTLHSSKNPPFAAITALQTLGILVVNLLR